MDVSVILCTWNNCRRLAITLDAIGRCVIPADLRWELVLVNNNCTDQTQRVAREFAAHLPLVYVEEPRQGLSRARNTGLQAASGRLIVFTDDDVRHQPEWLVAYSEAYRERPVGFYFGGSIACEHEDERPNDELLRVASAPVTGVDWGPEESALPQDQHFFGANWACPADALKRAGGFDVRLGLDASLGRRRVGEEWDLMDRLGGLGLTAWYLPRAGVVHFVPKWKSGMEYLGGNAEAHGAYAVQAAINTVPPYLRHRRNLRRWSEKRDRAMLGIPWRFYLETAFLGLHWCLARLRRRGGYGEYLAMRYCIGVIRGYRREMQRSIDSSTGSPARSR